MSSQVVKLTHNGDMVSTGLCLDIKGWFGDSSDRKYGRRAGYIFSSLVIQVCKLLTILIVQNQLQSDIANPGQQIVQLQEFTHVPYNKAGYEFDKGSL